MEWFHLVLVTTVMNFSTPMKVGNFLISGTTVSFSKETAPWI